MNELKAYSSACFVGGLLRLISSFVGYESASESIEVLHIETDLCLILGLIGFTWFIEPSCFGWVI